MAHEYVLEILILKKSVSKSLKFGRKWQFLCFKPILSAIFVTESNFQFLALEGAKIPPLHTYPLGENLTSRLEGDSVMGRLAGQTNGWTF